MKFFRLFLGFLLVSGTPLLAQGLVLGRDTLAYRLESGQVGVQDEYTFSYPTLPFATKRLQIIYDSTFDGKFDPQRITVRDRTSGEPYPLARAELDPTARAVTVQLKTALPKGSSPDIVLDQVRNPASDGVYGFHGKILEPGPFPSYRLVGDWFVTVSS